MVHTLRFRSVDQISTARTIAGVMMYSLKKPNSEFANSQEILFLEKWPVGVGKRTPHHFVKDTGYPSKRLRSELKQ